MKTCFMLHLLKGVLCSLTVLCIASSSAQPVFSGCNFEFGDVAIKSHNDNVFEGSAGENVIWDFSQVTVGSFDFLEIIEIAEAPFPDSFVDGDMTIISNSGYYDVIRCDGEMLSYLGEMTNSSALVYGDVREILRFPMTYLDEFVDSYERGAQVGIDSLLVDGYGTLILPYGTFENVLRVRTIDNSEVIGSGISWRSISYAFYHETSFIPLLGISHLNQLDFITHGVSFSDPNAVDVTNVERDKIKMFPNPVSDILHFNGLERGSTVNIYTLSGTLVQSAFSKETINSVPVDRLSAGLYFVQITDDHSTKVLRLEVIH